MIGTNFIRGSIYFDALTIANMGFWVEPGYQASLYQDTGFTTPARADGDPIGAWLDRSGAGRHCSQSTSARRPTLKLAIQNGLPVARYDAVDDTLPLSSAATGVTDLTCMFVAKRNSTGGGSVIMGQNGGGQYLADFFSDGKVYINSSGGGTMTTANYTANIFSIFTVWRSGSTFRVSQDGVQVGADLTVTGTFSLGIMGAFNAVSSNWRGDIAEMLLYTRALTNNEMFTVTSYLRTKWATP